MSLSDAVVYLVVAVLVLLFNTVVIDLGGVEK